MASKRERACQGIVYERVSEGKRLLYYYSTQRALCAEQKLQEGGAQRLGAKLGTVCVSLSCFSAAAFCLGAVSGASCSGDSRRLAADGYSRYCTIRVRAYRYEY